MNKIPVVFACDKLFFMPFMIAVESLLDNKAENTFYDVYCLTPCEQIEFTEKTDKLRQRYNNFSINFIYMNEHFENVDFGDAKISPVLYYRLKISDLLDDYDKAIYFDVDVIINGDLTEIYDVDLSDNYIGAVKHSPNRKWDKIKSYKINKGEYFNAGVQLINLKQLRKDNMVDKLMSLISENFPVLDQDLLNVACVNKVKFMPLRFNFLIKILMHFDVKDARQFYGVEFNEAQKAPLVIHYANPEKPWNFYNMPYQEYWDKYYNLSDYSSSKLNRKNFVFISVKKNVIFYIKSIIRKIFMGYEPWKKYRK